SSTARAAATRTRSSPRVSGRCWQPSGCSPSRSWSRSGCPPGRARRRRRRRRTLARCQRSRRLRNPAARGAKIHAPECVRTVADRALLYTDGSEFLAGTVPFVHEGLERDEAILVALPAHNLDLLRGALGSDAGRVLFADMEELGRNPARIIPAWRDFVDEHLP